jgi:hypothetical protein
MKPLTIFDVDDHRFMICPDNAMNVEGLSLTSSWKYNIKQAVIIQGPTYQEAIASAVNLGLQATAIESYNILDNMPVYYPNVDIKNIIVPPSHKESFWINQVRILNHRLDYRDVTRIFNHMTAWYHCISQGEPTVILESNARLTSVPKCHLPRSSIIGFDTGGKFHCHNVNYRVMPGVWAYSIDQFAAQRMFNSIIAEGIREPLELLFRADQRLILLQDHAYKINK